MPICVSLQAVCDYLEERANALADQHDIIDVHVLDGFNVETQHYNTVNAAVAATDANVSTSHADLQGALGNANGKLDNLVNNRSTLATVETDRYNTVAAALDTLLSGTTYISDAVTVPTGQLALLIAQRANTIDGKVDAANGRLVALTSDGVNSLSTILGRVGVPTPTLAGMLQSVLNALVEVQLTQQLERKAQPAYTVAAEMDWDQQLDWNQPADFYLVTVTTVGTQQGSQPSGVVRYPHVGWVAVKGPNGAVDQLQQIDFANRVVTSAGVQPRGLLLFAKPGTLGHVQACVHT